VVDEPPVAFADFYADRYREVLGVLTLVTGDRSTAEDVVHEALARAWERRSTIEHLDRWVVTVALNLARSRFRRAWREVLRRDPDDGAAPDGPEGLSVDLRRALARLPVRQREVIVLHYVLDLPVAEVAALLHLSPGGVKHALYRARGSLAGSLADTEETRRA
jgi:RNA polymerase sigma-70 factor (ECF subfamily)